MYSIQAVARRTGLSTHTIRAWERRYGVVVPARTATNRRMYAESDIRRLQLLRSAVEAGHNIGLISALDLEELEDLSRSTLPNRDSTVSTSWLADCLHAVKHLNRQELEDLFDEATARMGVDRVLRELVLPLVHELSVGWAEGRISIVQEHLASALIRAQLEKLRELIRPAQSEPELLVTTLQGDLHELGALIVTVAAAYSNWKSTYLGPNLPADEIVQAMRQSKADALALSIVYPVADSNIEREIRSIGSQLAKTPIIVGGRAVPSYSTVLNEIGAKIAINLDDLNLILATIR